MKTLVLMLIFATAVMSAASQTSAQKPKVDGPWYGTLSGPDGTPLEVVLQLQKQTSGWTGTLNIGGGTPAPLWNVTVSGNTLSFTVGVGQSGQPNPAVSGRLADGGETLDIVFTRGQVKFPLMLTRSITAPLTEGIDPNELIEMMSSVSGPLSERPFVPPVTHPAIGYGLRKPHDPVANLMADIETGKTQLKFEGEEGYLHSLLEALKIPIESQMTVFSKTSVQSGIIDPSNPRKLYFNDTVVVGYVGGGFIEMAAQDPEQGMSFYMMQQVPSEKPSPIKRDQCLSCHLTRNSMDIPGMVLRSVFPASDGAPINPLGSHVLDHRTPIEDRFGGWYVTGSTGSMKHLGNATFTQSGEAQPISGHYSSDIVAILIFDHQMHMMNLITRVGWDFRLANYLRTATGMRNETIDRQLRDEVNEFVDYLLFVDEAPLKSKIQGMSGFAEKFAAAGPMDSKARSLRQLDLEHHLMRYRCSYMIYSPAFDALPAEAKAMIYARIPEVLSAKYSSADRQAVVEILRDTKKDLPTQFK